MHSILFSEPKLCHRCFESFNPVLRRFSVQNIDAFHIYYYDDVIKEKLYQLKGCFDYELAPIFLEYFIPFLRIKYFGYTLIPAPSFIDADKERGFNHVVEIFKSIGLPILSCIKKNKDVKQADLKSEERSKIKDYLTIDNVDLSNKKILLVDDVFTTGSTIKAMIDLVSSKHPRKIKILVMSKTAEIDNYDIK